MQPVSILEWGNYLTALAGAAATLTGLVFVAVSINLTRVISIPGLTGRAAESLMQLFGVLIISTTALIPRQSTSILGAEIAAIGAALWLFQTLTQIRYVRSRPKHPFAWIMPRVTQTQFASIPFCVAGILLMRGSPAGFYWLAPGFIFSLISGVVSAWVLLIEILR